eukprot:gnl/Trimastix_PCT/3890.p1 GENE.gnl/Trimastix_PCT/3890~~gnl/Trimastix_PCT/3890.p1  ORF type:complete len:746 (-),score=227.11 gnl/Trimastix_PCT/3890:38-2275(-)
MHRSKPRPPSFHELQKQRKQLPIFPARERIIEEVRKNPCLVVVGETGSGKTTQLPQYLLESGILGPKRMVGVVQPRRVAAVSIARRVAQEQGCQVGKEVGYSVRFEDCTTHGATRIKYLTDGMLLREALLDPLLRKYSVIVLDEAHERTLHTDILFGLLKGIAQQRNPQLGTEGTHSNKRTRITKGHLPPLKIIIMSATLEAEAFSKYFWDSSVLYIRGRQFPVETFFTKEPQADYVDAALTAILQLHMEMPFKRDAGHGAPGEDILVFLTGQEEIETLAKLIKHRHREITEAVASDDELGGEQMDEAQREALRARAREEADDLIVLPLFASLPHDQQLRVFEPAPLGKRKVILATNIAETSLTISGVRTVLDTGLVKAKRFHPRTGLETLWATPISRDSARQRTGRAGREAPGRCYRLYTEDTYYQELTEHTTPEIRRCSLTSVVLQLKCIGVRDVATFDFLEPPSQVALERASQTLQRLGALDAQGNLVEPLAREMAALPLDPQFAKVILTSRGLGVTADVLTIAAMLSVENIFFSPQALRTKAEQARARFAAAEGDHITLIYAYNAYSEVRRKHDARFTEHWCRDHFLNYRALLKVDNVREQLAGYCTQLNIDPRPSCLRAGADGRPTEHFDSSPILKCLLAGYFQNVAYRLPGQRNLYRTLSSQEVALHPSSVLLALRRMGVTSGAAGGRVSRVVDTTPECVVYTELLMTTKLYVRTCSAIDPSWVPEHAGTASTSSTPAK